MIEQIIIRARCCACHSLPEMGRVTWTSASAHWAADEREPERRDFKRDASVIWRVNNQPADENYESRGILYHSWFCTHRASFFQQPFVACMHRWQTAVENTNSLKACAKRQKLTELASRNSQFSAVQIIYVAWYTPWEIHCCRVQARLNETCRE